MMEIGKHNNIHESSPARASLKDPQNLSLTARVEVVPGKEDFGSPWSQHSWGAHSPSLRLRAGASCTVLSCRIT